MCTESVTGNSVCEPTIPNASLENWAGPYNEFFTASGTHHISNFSLLSNGLGDTGYYFSPGGSGTGYYVDEDVGNSFPVWIASAHNYGLAAHQCITTDSRSDVNANAFTSDNLDFNFGMDQYVLGLDYSLFPAPMANFDDFLTYATLDDPETLLGVDELPLLSPVPGVFQTSLPLVLSPITSGTIAGSGFTTAQRRRFECSRCHKRSTRATDLNRHPRIVHRSPLQATHLCPIAGCPKASGPGYSRKDKVTEHLRLKHKD